MTGPRAQGGPAAPVRVAVVGLGWAANSIWLPRLREHPGYTVSAVVDPDPAARAAVARDRTGTELLSSVEELDRSIADLAVVAVPNHLHSSIASRLLANGIPVFVEKPVCLNSAEADQLAAAERTAGAVLLAGSAAQYRADVLALTALVPQLGRIRHVDLSWIRARGVPDAGGWFTRRELSGGGALVDLGWHLLDVAGPLLGPVVFEQVSATVSGDFVEHGSAKAAWRHQEEGGQEPGEQAGPEAEGVVDVEDTVRGFLITDGGISIALRASWASHEPHDVTLLRVEGSHGTAILRCTFGFSPNRVAGSTLTLTRDGVVTDVAFEQEPIGAEYYRQLDELPAQLADPAARGRTIAEVRRTIGVIERIYQSARSARAAAGPGAKPAAAQRPAVAAPTLSLLSTGTLHDRNPRH